MSLPSLHVSVFSQKLVEHGFLLITLTNESNSIQWSLYLKLKVLVAQTCLTLIPWAVAREAPLSMGLSRQEYWNGWPFLSPRDLPNLRIEPRSPELQANPLPSEKPEKPGHYTYLLSCKCWTYLRLKHGGISWEFMKVYVFEEATDLTWNQKWKFLKMCKITDFIYFYTVQKYLKECLGVYLLNQMIYIIWTCIIFNCTHKFNKLNK